MDHHYAVDVVVSLMSDPKQHPKFEVEGQYVLPENTEPNPWTSLAIFLVAIVVGFVAVKWMISFILSPIMLVVLIVAIVWYYRRHFTDKE